MEETVITALRVLARLEQDKRGVLSYAVAREDWSQAAEAASYLAGLRMAVAVLEQASASRIEKIAG